MKKCKCIMAGAAALLISGLAACGGGGGGANNPGGGGCDSTGFSQVSSSNITLKWKVEGTNLKVRVTAPTTGWVALGIMADPTPQNLMNGSNLIIGYYSGGAVSIRDDFADTQISHQPDLDLGGTNDVSETCGSESGGVTEIGFTIPLDSGDAYDIALTPGTTYNLGLAYAADGADTFVPKHAFRVLVQQAF